MEIARRACVLNHYRKEKMRPGATTLEAFADFRDWLKNDESAAREYENQITEAEVLRFLKEPATNNISSPEMLYCSSSSGEHFEKRAKELRASSNIVDGILAHSHEPQLLETV